MKTALQAFAAFAVPIAIIVVPLFIDGAIRDKHREATDPHAWDPHYCEPPAWIPDTLCNGRPAITSWNRTDEYRLKTGDMFFEWEYDENGDSCLWGIVVRLPEGTIENRARAMEQAQRARESE